MPKTTIIQRKKSFPFISIKSTPTRFSIQSDPHSPGGYFYGTSLSTLSNLKDTTTKEGQAYAYNYCHAVNTVINRKVRAHINGIWVIEDTEGNPAEDRMPNIARLLDRPNPVQSWAQFNAQQKLFTQIFGECIVLPLIPIGFDRSQVQALWIIPNWMWTKQYTGKFYQQTELSEVVSGYLIDNGHGEKLLIKPYDVIHLTDLTSPVTMLDREYFNGQSRLYALKWAVWNIHAAMEGRNVMITKRGAIGILSNDSKDVAGLIPVDPKEKTDVQNQFQQYGLAATQAQVIITNASLKWQQMTLPTKDLLLFEETEDSTLQIADAYDLPPDLLGSTGSKKTYQNVLEAKKSLYQDAIIPESIVFSEAYTNWLLKGTGLQFKIYYDHLEVFQKSKKEEAEGIKAITDSITVLYEKTIITKEEARMFLEQFITEYGFEAETPNGTTYSTTQQATPMQLQLTPQTNEPK